MIWICWNLPLPFHTHKVPASRGAVVAHHILTVGVGVKWPKADRARTAPRSTILLIGLRKNHMETKHGVFLDEGRHGSPSWKIRIFSFHVQAPGCNFLSYTTRKTRSKLLALAVCHNMSKFGLRSRFWTLFPQLFQLLTDFLLLNLACGSCQCIESFTSDFRPAHPLGQASR